ncbi:FRG domain-containing protein [Aeromonas dhakensis]|uniref:FRG domain-containing protein n=1 Tax=Aeromonas dhakensis TaxID=196024 RepID=UPI001FCB8EE5|nr:FRG domain-containing protein [Aeromonas dhakensis]MCJ2368219.1 FRG domain-containing protein [Aeromonas dhakensis]
MLKNFYKEIPISNWDVFKKYISDFDGQLVFRGQREATWGLRTSLERDFNGLAPTFFEMQVVEKFQQRAPHYIKSGLKPSGLMEWLALMQHHGAPTRLLDWTFSPYVSAYFALANSTGESAVWAVDYSWLKMESASIIAKSKTIKSDQAGGIITDTWFNKLNFLELIHNDEEKLIVPMIPKTLNERQIIQQGLFLFGSHKEYSFEGNLLAYKDKGLKDHLFKFNLDCKLRRDALYDLRLMNITSATLFPGLDGLAQSISLEIQLGVEI